MLNVIFSLIDIRSILTEQQIIEWNKKYDFVADLPGSRIIDDRILYQGNISNLSQLEIVLTELQLIGGAPDIIGVWDIKSGLQQGYIFDMDGNIIREFTYDENGDKILVPIAYPFNITEYQNYLADIITYDDNGNEISRTRPTEEQARNIEINSFFGTIKRNLQSL